MCTVCTTGYLVVNDYICKVISPTLWLNFLCQGSHTECWTIPTTKSRCLVSSLCEGLFCSGVDSLWGDSCCHSVRAISSWDMLRMEALVSHCAVLWKMSSWSLILTPIIVSAEGFLRVAVLFACCSKRCLNLDSRGSSWSSSVAFPPSRPPRRRSRLTESCCCCFHVGQES